MEHLQRRCEDDRKESSLTCICLPAKQKLCMNLLANGKPKAFIELFNLTHSRESEERLDDKATKEKTLPSERLIELSDNLQDAEMARRVGDVQRLSDINFSLGKLCEKFDDYKMAVCYYVKAMINAKQAENCDREAEVKFSLGVVYMKVGDYANAILSFEEYLQYSRRGGNNESLIAGSIHLLEVYQTSAKMAQKLGHFEKSIAFYQKSIDMAKICKDERAKAEVKHEMGLIYQTLSLLDLALQYQSDYLEFCCHENDQFGKSKAYAALAEVQQMMGNTDIAFQYLESLLQISYFVDLKTQAIACCKMGMMYSSQNIYDKALTYFEMFFRYACKLKEPTLIDAARVNIGFVRCTFAMPESSCSKGEENCMKVS